MNDRELKYKSSTYILGKEFIIVIVVFSSAVSFTLGYFVGKSTRVRNPESSSQLTEVTPLPQEHELPSVSAERPGKQQQNSPVSDYHRQDSEQQRGSLPAETKAEAPSVRTADKTRPTMSGIKQREQEIIYTVQIAAFKNAVEAEKIKEKYSKKGYDTYVTVSRLKGDDKIYKIRAGEFRDRKDAELLALKIKRTEGLNPFVTFRNK